MSESVPIGAVGTSRRGRVAFTEAAAELQARAGLDPTSIYVWSDDAGDIVEMSRATIAWKKEVLSCRCGHLEADHVPGYCCGGEIEIAPSVTEWCQCSRFTPSKG